MENAVDDLKIAFAMFIFVLSLSIAFMAFSQAMQTSNKMYLQVILQIIIAIAVL